MSDLRARLTALETALGNLRHAYQQGCAGTIGDQRAFVDGLIAPAIRALEAALLREPPETPPPDQLWLLRNIHMAARRALSFGHQATTTITPARMIERKEEHLQTILRWCEEGGVEPSSVLRAAAPEEGATP